MSNFAHITKAQAEKTLRICDEILEDGALIKAGKSAPLDKAALEEMREMKLINKAAYIQLAIAHDYGVLTNPNLSPQQTREFAERWSLTGTEIMPTDMRKAIDIMISAIFKNDDGGEYPQLSLFE